MLSAIPLSAQKPLENDVIRYTVKPIRWFFTFNGGLAFRF